MLCMHAICSFVLFFRMRANGSNELFVYFSFSPKKIFIFASRFGERELGVLSLSLSLGQSFFPSNVRAAAEEQ